MKKILFVLPILVMAFNLEGKIEPPIPTEKITEKITDSEMMQKAINSITNETKIKQTMYASYKLVPLSAEHGVETISIEKWPTMGMKITISMQGTGPQKTFTKQELGNNDMVQKLVETIKNIAKKQKINLDKIY